MTTARARLVSYLADSDRCPWQWSEDGRVIVWFDGTTIAFREELGAILSRLAPQGLPPFGAVVLLLAAVKGKVPDAWWLAPERNEASKGRVERALDGVADLMSLSRGVPALAEPRGKAALIEVLLETEPRALPPEAAAELVPLLAAGATVDERSARESTTSLPRTLEHIEALGRGWQGFDARGFELRMRTGLDALPLPPEEPGDLRPPCERARQLLVELELDSDEVFAGVAKLTRDLMAAIYFPHRLLPRDEAPSGGYADVSNRGSLDRLLLSELAHDDLTLAVRVALNEALYVKREPPAELPEGELVLLLDSGLRLWGVPRVFATAVALALIAVQGRKRSVVVYRARGRRVEPVDFLSREGLVEHLGTIDPELHPGRALGAFAETLRELGDSAPEAVIVTEADTVEDRDFRAELRQLDLSPLYLASVTRAGRFRLMAHPVYSKALSEASLDLEAIAPRPDSSPPLLDVSLDPELPVILGVRPFPFLLPVRGRVEKVVNLPGGEGACVTRDGRLFHWTGRDLCARVLVSSLPRGQVACLALEEDAILIVKTRSGVASILWFDRATDEVRTVEQAFAPEDGLQVEKAEVLYRSGVLLFVQKGVAVAVHARRGEKLGQSRRWVARDERHGYVAGDPWRRLVWNGVALELVDVAIPSVSNEDVLLFFDWSGCEGPLALVRGQGIRRSTGEIVLHGDVAAMSGIAESGRRVAARASDGSYLLFDLATRDVARKETYDMSWLEAKDRFVPSRSMRSKLRAVALERGELLFQTVKGQALSLTPRGEAKLVLDEVTVHRGVPFETFRPHPVSPRYGCELSVATFDSGARVFLDSRGPLHFKPGGDGGEEVSLLLGDWAAAAWSSDGGICGPRIFLGEPSNRSADEMLAKIVRILEPTS